MRLKNLTFWRGRPLAIAAVLAVLALGGIGTALAVTASTGTAVACASATVGAQTIAVNGTPITTVPEKVASHCETVTYTIPTVTTTVGGTTTTSGGTTTQAQTLAANAADTNLATENVWSGAQNPPYVCCWNQDGQYVTFTFQAAGDTDLTLRYSAGAGDAVRRLVLDGNVLNAAKTFPATADWNTWSTLTLTHTFTSGTHTLKVVFSAADASNEWLNLDNLTVSASTGGTTTTTTTAATTTTPTTTTTSTTSGAVNEQIDWETGDLSQAAAIECPSQSKDLALRTDIVRKGKYAIWLHVDSNSGLWGNGIPRCLYNGTSTQKNGDDYYYGFSFRLAHAQTDDVWELHQPASIYNIDGCAVAPFALFTSHYGSYNGTYFRIATGDCTSAMAGYATGWPHQEMNIPLPDLQPEPVGTWIDVVVHIKFAETASGTVEVWARTGSNPYRLQLTRSGIPTTQFSSMNNVHDANLYMQAGVYPGAKNWTGDDEIIEDEYRRGTTFDAVAP